MRQQILIVEDKKAHMDALCKIIHNLHKDIEIFCVDNASDAYKIAMERRIHLFLVDIILNVNQPGDTAGLKFVQEMRGTKKYAFTPIIFITSLEDPKLFSYSQLHCFGYIEKPFSIEQVRKCVLDALEFPVAEDKERCVFFRKEGIVYAKYLKEIILIEGGRRRIIVHCINDKLEIPYMTCEEIMKELDSQIFIRCSRYAIINRKFVEQIDYINRFVKLKGIDKLVEIGIKTKKTFKSEMENGSSNS